MIRWLVQRLIVVLVTILASCGNPYDQRIAVEAVASDRGGLRIDPATGIPYAVTFQHPIVGFDHADYGFGFGLVNNAFCEKRASDGSCAAYGHHLGRDTVVRNTPVGTEIVAPADGIVRVTTDVTFGALGSSNRANPDYQGCAIVLEHLLNNGQAVTTLLEHVRCEAWEEYDPHARRGNPPVGTIVRRGQYVAHIWHYWPYADTSVDWHHLHWGMRKGRFEAPANSHGQLVPYIQGYAPRTEFTIDPSTGALVHPVWLDPLLVLAANGDPVAQASADVRFHPSGSLLQDLGGQYWFVQNDTEIVSISPGVFVSDRHDPDAAVRVSDEEVSCYRHVGSMPALGQVTLYVRPGTNTVVMAYDQSWERYDVIRWEALLSWGYGEADISSQPSAPFYESSYLSRGFRLLRPGTLVKADEQSEVAIVTAQQTRLPIASGDVFERAGFAWQRIVSIPLSVLDQVAGPREARVLAMDDLRVCAVPPACPSGSASCGGGAPSGCAPGDIATCWCSTGNQGTQSCVSDGSRFSECVCPSSDAVGGSGGGVDADAGNPEGSGNDVLHLRYESPIAGELTIQGWWQHPDGSTRSWGVIPCSDTNETDALLECDVSVPSGAPIFEFQIYLPGPKYWGDQSCDSGGCNQPLGTVLLIKNGNVVPYAFAPNSIGPPYYNGRLMPVP